MRRPRARANSRTEQRFSLAASLQDLPERAVLDPVLMYQAFFNIITNAYQHSEDGDGISIHGAAEGATMNIYGAGYRRGDSR